MALTQPRPVNGRIEALKASMAFVAVVAVETWLPWLRVCTLRAPGTLLAVMGVLPVCHRALSPK